MSKPTVRGIIFLNLPLNTKSIYVGADDKSGCTVYLPAESHEQTKQLKQNLINFLEQQPEPIKARE